MTANATSQALDKLMQKVDFWTGHTAGPFPSKFKQMKAIAEKYQKMESTLQNIQEYCDHPYAKEKSADALAFDPLAS